MGFKAFLQALDPATVEDYRRAYWQETRGGRTAPTHQRSSIPIENSRPVRVSKFSIDSEHFTPLLTLPDHHACRTYAIRRRLPESHWNYLGFTENFGQLVADVGWGASGAIRAPVGRALVIAVVDPSGALIGAQARFLLPSAPMRYITAHAPDTHPIFGLHNLKVGQLTYLTEGPLDSLCLQNGVAVMNSGLDVGARKVTELYGMNTDHWVRVYDAEPRSLVITTQMLNTIMKGFPIVLWNMSIMKELGAKDVNDLVRQKDYDPETMSRVLATMTFQGLRARARFQEWRQC